MFVLALILFSLILRKVKAAYEFSESKEKINHLLFMDGLKLYSQWYEHEPECFLENEDYKILWHFSIQTDHVIEARSPDLVVIDKKERSCKIIDFAVPRDSRIEEKEKDKIEKYQVLGRELQMIWNVKLKIIPLVVGSLGATPKRFGNRLKQIGITVGTAQVQKTVLLGMARISRRVLEI